MNAFTMGVEKLQCENEMMIDSIRTHFINRNITVDQVKEYSSKSKDKESVRIKEAIYDAIFMLKTYNATLNNAQSLESFKSDIVYDVVAYINSSIKESLEDNAQYQISYWNGKEVTVLTDIDVLTTMIFDLYQVETSRCDYNNPNMMYRMAMCNRGCRVLEQLITDNDVLIDVLNLRVDSGENFASYLMYTVNDISNRIFDIYRRVLVMDYNSFKSFEDVYIILVNEILRKNLYEYINTL